MPTNQQIEACAKEIAKSAYYKTAGCSLSVSWLSEIITRHLSAPVYESIAQTVSRINDTPARVESEKPCKYCGSDKGTWYRPTEPKGNFCQTCGKCCDEDLPQSTPSSKLDEVCEKLMKEQEDFFREHNVSPKWVKEHLLKQACLEAIALDRQTR